MTNNEKNVIMTIRELSEPQKALLEYCLMFGWGKLEVTVKNGQPVMVSPIRQEVKLD